MTPIYKIVSAYMAGETIESLAEKYNIPPKEVAELLFAQAFNLDGTTKEILEDLRVENGQVQCTVCEKSYPIADYPLDYNRPSWRCKDCRYKNDMMKKFGITLAECEELISSTVVCEICGNKDNDRRLAIDHCHKSGKIRGLLCSACNKGLGSFKDDPTLLEKAIAYLKGGD